MTVLYQIQLRNDTAANWTAANPVLAAGEVGVETDTLKFKVGNGTLAWSSLPYGGNVGTGNITALSGDVTATGPGAVPATVASVGGVAAASVATAATAANAATNLNTASAIVKRDSSGNFSAGTITANVTGNVSGTAANVTGTVATANGGTGQNSTATFPTSGVVVTEAGTETLTNKTITAPVISTIVNTGTLTLPTATDTLVGRATTDTLTNKTISGVSNTLTVRLDSDVTNTLPVGSGGTGQTTANAALNALLPTQTGQAGNVLTTNGTSTAWAAGLTTVLNQSSTFVGNSSNTATPTNTSLLGNVTAQVRSQTVTVTIATPGVFTATGHGMANGDKFYLTTTGALPTGLSASTTYYAANVAANTFDASTSYANSVAGTYIATSGTQSGTHTLNMGGLTVNPGPAANRSPTITSYVAHATGTYSTPSNVAWLRVRMVGAGGGGSAGGTSVSVAATAGGATSFGTSLLSAGGGGAGGLTDGGAGGTAVTFSAPAVGFQTTGGDGGPSMPIRAGGNGGASAFGGGGRGGTVASTGAGRAGQAAGSGGGGGDGGGTESGAGGGAGNFIDAIIPNPGASYSYTVGQGGTAGTAAGGDGEPGGAGADGLIIIEEHYY